MTRLALLFLAAISAIAMIVVHVSLVSYAPYTGKGDPSSPYQKKVKALIEENEEFFKQGTTADNITQIRSNILGILKNDPTRYTPYLHEALAEITISGTLKRPDLLLKSAKSNPRNQTSLMLLAQHYIQNESYDEALDAIDTLYRLNVDGRDNYLHVLELINNNPEGHLAIKRSIPQRKGWMRIFLGKLMGEQAELDANYYAKTEMLKSFIGAKLRKEDKDLLKKYFLMTARLEQYEEAHEYWTKLSGNAPSNSLIFNSKFLPDQSFPPFDWDLRYGKLAGAEYDGIDGLYAYHNSDKAHFLARQVFPVNAEDIYQSHIGIRSAVDENRAQFEWRFICRPLNVVWHVVTVEGQTKSETVQETILPPVPVGCSFTELQLWARPGKYTGHSNVTFDSLTLMQYERG